MDGFDVSQAPQDYQAVKPLADLFVLGMGLGWVINYVGMVYTSFKERTYGMAIMPLCCNIAWEIVYCVVHPSKSRIELGVFVIGLLINFGVMYAAIVFSSQEWSHAPLVERNLPWIFCIGVIGFLTGHLALAAEIGPSLAYSWGAVVCQLLLSVGGLCQLLCRGSTRGASYTLCPLVLWSLAVFLLVDGSYGLCYWYVKRYELSVLMKPVKKAN
ncbi:uncharacterized protein N7473_001054 [Penicillium subrubescens]|uniref:Uncharacterized protein n=1 Tax=Penicillium subrubescens TaxID=1316194 RepID=A0A1Q5UKD5_9EURO|nr:uncharacterized protein N7473_001054 [Penicillium subrubescens]KAJ5911751.1 hypothetical protein N7473_001054 [Penicillium subrubescens]OKP12948.1 hypothetical protein PENSUB_1391 [Penicillium subrubescens]